MPFLKPFKIKNIIKIIAKNKPFTKFHKIYEQNNKLYKKILKILNEKPENKFKNRQKTYK